MVKGFLQLTEQHIKICGITTQGTMKAAGDFGADLIGYVFYDKSPRFLRRDAARLHIAKQDPCLKAVGLFVDPDDETLGLTLANMKLDYIQLHGSESPERCQAINTLFGVPIIKAIGVRQSQDLNKAAAYDGHVAMMLFDAKPQMRDQRPGGLGRKFDWDLLHQFSSQTPWLLSGGLTPENIGDAIGAVKSLPGFAGVDVSSGVESSPGEKDLHRMNTFIKAAQSAMAKP
jgi:phosphoribosylanthranilate isomerase